MANSSHPNNRKFAKNKKKNLWNILHLTENSENSAGSDSNKSSEDYNLNNNFEKQDSSDEIELVSGSDDRDNSCLDDELSLVMQNELDQEHGLDQKELDHLNSDLPGPTGVNQLDGGLSKEDPGTGKDPLVMHGMNAEMHEHSQIRCRAQTVDSLDRIGNLFNETGDQDANRADFQQELDSFEYYLDYEPENPKNVSQLNQFEPDNSNNSDFFKNHVEDLNRDFDHSCVLNAELEYENELMIHDLDNGNLEADADYEENFGSSGDPGQEDELEYDLEMEYLMDRQIESNSNIFSFNDDIEHGSGEVNIYFLLLTTL